MHRLTDEKNNVIFESHFELAGDNITLSNNTNYKFTTCAECCQLTSKVYKNNRLIKTIVIEPSKTKSYPFRTGVNDSYNFIFEKDCFSSSPLVAKSQTIPATCIQQGVINLSVSGGEAPYSYLWSNGDTTPDIIDVAGNYSVTITDSKGKTLVHSAIIASDTVVATATVVNETTDNGSITLFVSGGQAPYAYIWSNGATTKDISSLASGSYSVIITDSNGCTFSQIYTVTQLFSIETNILRDSDCNRITFNAIDLIINGGVAPYTYMWLRNGTPLLPNPTLRNRDINLLPAVYQITVTDNIGQVATSTETISNPPIAIGIGFNYSGGTLTASVINGINYTAPFTFEWFDIQTNNLLGTGASILASPNISYNLRFTDANGCRTGIVHRASTRVSGFTEFIPMANMSYPNSFNSGLLPRASIDITINTHSSAPYIFETFTYLWSNGSTSSSISNLLSGTYTCTITGSLGLTKSLTFTVPLLPTVTINTTIIPSSGGMSNGGVVVNSVSNLLGPYHILVMNNTTKIYYSDLLALPSGLYLISIVGQMGSHVGSNFSIP